MSTSSPERRRWGAAPAGCRVEASVFRPQLAGAAREVHLIVRAPDGGRFAERLAQVEADYRFALGALGLDAATVVHRRGFVSDAANQRAMLDESALFGPDGLGAPVAASYIEQAPCPGGKLALWAYHVDDGAPLDKRRLGAASVALRRPGLTHLWTVGLEAPGAGDEGAQTLALFDNWESELALAGGDLADAAVRTWLYVRDIDARYGGLVAARRDRFAERGLTPATHFIASTGIEGRTADPRATVRLDAVAAVGLDPAQVSYLSAPTHLCPTADYGVTFERGVSVDYGDRRQVYLSGTASIDVRGEVVHVGDVERQTRRVVDNLEALLASAEAGLEALAVLLVYLRDPADHAAVNEVLEARVPGVPRLLLRGAVCRPGWLVEIEAVALSGRSVVGLPRF